MAPFAYRLLTATVALCLVPVTASGQGDSLQQAGLEVLNLDLDLIQRPRQAPTVTTVSTNWQSEDILRRRVAGFKVTDLGAESGGARLFLPLRVSGRTVALDLTSGNGGVDYAGRSAGPGWQSRVSGRERRIGAAGMLSANEHDLRLAFSHRRLEGKERTVEIERFHRSDDDDRMNRFFWDLLEPTLSNRIDYDWEALSRDLSAAYGYRVTTRDRLTLRAGRRTTSDRIDAVYHNNGDRDELRGDRPVAARRTGTVVEFATVYEHAFLGNWTGAVAIGLRRRSSDAVVRQHDVPVSARQVLLDRTVLGTADGSQDSRHLYVSADWTARVGPDQPTERGAGPRARLLAGRVVGEFSGSFEGNTPVLGFSLLTLPISHGANGDIEGSTRSTVLGAAGTVTRGRLDFGASVYGAWSEVSATTRGDAEMQFGLEVNPLRETGGRGVNLYRLEMRPAWNLQSTCAGSLRIAVYLRQYLIEVEKGERKPPAPVLKKEEEVRGGRTVGLELTLSRS